MGYETSPMPIAETDRNGVPEAYGLYRNFTSSAEPRVYEVNTNGSVTLKGVYERGLARMIVDVDHDDLKEVILTYGEEESDYEQVSPDSIPTHLNFIHQTLEGGLDPGFSGEWIGSLDGDSLADFLYKGSEIDSIGNGISKIYVAEYDATINNLVRVWSTIYEPGPQSGVGGFAVEDFDRDGLMEYAVVVSLSGAVFVTENDSDNSYTHTWFYDTPFTNMYYLTSGDVDGDGKAELFVGATMSSGNWTMVFEAGANNTYSSTFLFHMLSAGIFDLPTYLTSDMDGDGKPELVILSGRHLFVFKSPADNTYELWYYKRFYRQRSVQTYKFFGDPFESILISRDTVDQYGRPRYFTDIYRPGQPFRWTERVHHCLPR